MATRAQKTKVGIFLLFSAALFVVGMVLISGLNTEPTHHYLIQFRESVLGLGVGGLVEYLGLPVGQVEDMYVTDEGFAEVRIEVREDKVTLRKGVTARLVMYSLATGTMAISLQGGDPQAPVLPDGAIIPSEESLLGSFTQSLDSIMDRVEEVMENVGQAATTINTAMADMDEGAVTRIVENVEALTSESRTAVENANRSIEQLSQSVDRAIREYTEVGEKAKWLIDDVGEATESANTLLKTVQEKIEPVDLAAIQGDLREAIQSIKETSDRLQQTAGTVDTLGASFGYDMDNLQRSIGETLRSATEAFDAINELANMLQEDPAALLRGRGRAR